MSTDITVRPEQGLFAVAPKFDMPMLRQSIASVMISKSPLHAWHKAFGEAEEDHTAALDTGTLAHTLLLGGNSIVVVQSQLKKAGSLIEDAKSYQTEYAAAHRDAIRAEGKIPVLAHKLVEAEALTLLVQGELAYRDIILDGQSEVTAVWQSPTGVWCQGRLDHWIPDTATIYDFKFCQSASPYYIAKAMCDYGADIQRAAYVQGIETIFPKLAGRVDMVFIYVETEPPNAITLVRAGGVMRGLGESKWGRAVDYWRKYLKEYGTGTPWPAFGTEIVEVDPPAYMMTQWITDSEIADGGNL